MFTSNEFSIYSILNENDDEKWRATLASIEAEIAHYTDVHEKAKRESNKRLRQDAIADVLNAARWMSYDILQMLESKRRRVVAEIARIEAEARATQQAAEAA